MSNSPFHGGAMETTFTHIRRLLQSPFAITPWRLLPSLSTTFRASTAELINFVGFSIGVSLVFDIVAILVVVF